MGAQLRFWLRSARGHGRLSQASPKTGTGECAVIRLFYGRRSKVGLEGMENALPEGGFVGMAVLIESGGNAV